MGLYGTNKQSQGHLGLWKIDEIIPILERSWIVRNAWSPIKKDREVVMFISLAERGLRFCRLLLLIGIAL